MPADFAERSGKIHEAFLLGEVRHGDLEYSRVLHELGLDTKGYLPYRKALEFAKRFQPLDPETHKPQDPTDPWKAFPKELRLAIAEKLGLEDEKDMDRLHYYTTVGSPLDVFHGVDCVIELEGRTPKEGNRDVTFDVTLQSEPGSKEDVKANVIVRELHEEDSPEFLKDVDEVAAQAVPFLESHRRAA